jgi:UDP-GlcNAc3NAcA epimerase
MSDIFFRQLRIPLPDHQLQIRGSSHNDMIGNMLIGIDPVLAAERPDCVAVYGDTNTTLAGALAAKKRNIPVAHIESGIRTGKEDMPEESNRYLTDRIAHWNFASTALGAENLKKDGFGINPDSAIRSAVYNCGDLLLDASLLFRDRARERPALPFGPTADRKPFILATIHRAENTEHKTSLQEIVKALDSIHAQTPVIFPMHPKTREAMRRFGITPHFTVTDPLGYLDMLALTQACRSVITDSGGLSRGFLLSQANPGGHAKPILARTLCPWQLFALGGGGRRHPGQTGGPGGRPDPFSHRDIRRRPRRGKDQRDPDQGGAGPCLMLPARAGPQQGV